jgi:peptide chain release factor 2
LKKEIEELEKKTNEPELRSYIFYPYTLVKDHRTGYEEGNVNSVMDGEIDGFINAYLVGESAKR